MPAPSSSSQTDQQLVAAINRGDTAAFEQLYQRYRRWVLTMALRLTGNHADALDVLQETFAYIVRKFPGFELRASMTTFLYPAIRNLSIAANRRRRRSMGATQKLDDLECIPPQPSADMDDLNSVLTSLSADHREILLLRFVDELSQAEIATVLEIPLGTVKSRLHHAILVLRQLPRIAGCFGLKTAAVDQQPAEGTRS